MRKIFKDFRSYVNSTQGHESLDNSYERGLITIEEYFKEIMNMNHAQDVVECDEAEIEIGNVKFSRKEVEDMYYRGERYLVTHSKVCAIEFSTASNLFYAREIYVAADKSVHFAKRGQVLSLDAKGVNEILGFSLLNE